ncbi:MAG: aminotransferase class V-fold PLP-dependent enzyme [Anaerolinea sp.]|nr:aminotransferase class V-fold PLP-dependent enzyme [Anaerolinea sp.]
MPLDLPALHQHFAELKSAAQQANPPAQDDVQQALCDFFNAQSAQQISLWPDWQTLNLQLSQTLFQMLPPGALAFALGDEFSSEAEQWKAAAAQHGIQLSWLTTDPQRGTLSPETWQAALNAGPRLLLLDAAAPTGLIYPLPRLLRQERPSHPIVIVNARPLAAHAPLDVQRFNCDALLCPGNALFGPPLGLLYQRQPIQSNTTAVPSEALSALQAALDYLQWLGQTYGVEFAERYAENFSGRPLDYKQAMAAIRSYEFELSHALLEELARIPGIELLGPNDPYRVEERIPCFTFRLPTPPEYLPNTPLTFTACNNLLKIEAFHYHTSDEASAVVASLRVSQSANRTAKNQPEAI